MIYVLTSRVIALEITKPLRLLIEEHELEAKEFLTKALASIGLTSLRPIKSVLLHTLIVSIIDLKRWAWHLMTINHVMNEAWRLISHVGDMDEVSLFIDENLLETAIEDTNKLLKLNDYERSDLVDTIRFFALFLKEVEKNTPYDFKKFSAVLRDFVIDNLSKLIDEKVYAKKAKYFGKLLAIKRATPYRVAQLALLCFPIVDIGIADTYLYLLAKILKIWPNADLAEFHCPMDPSIIRVGVRIGLFNRRFKTSRYGGYRYRIFQNIAKALFPNDPTKLYTLRYVGEVFCTPYKKKCDECWLFGICKYYLASTS